MRGHMNVKFTVYSRDVGIYERRWWRLESSGMLRGVHSLLILIINISHILEQLFCYHVTSS